MDEVTQQNAALVEEAAAAARAMQEQALELQRQMKFFRLEAAEVAPAVSATRAPVSAEVLELPRRSVARTAEPARRSAAGGAWTEF
jgi:methyl-accepting chemotaxis protein